MREQELWKKVPIYFYYLSISKHKDAKDDSAYSTDQIIIAFSQLLEYIMTKGLPERKKDITSSEKVVWLDSYEDLKNGNYDVIFKSAKYNHVRNEIDTETMQERGRRKRPQDGDEEKTHLCIRLAKGENRFLAVHESKDSQDKAKGKIKRIKIIGTNDAGSFEVDTNITGMKHFLKVKGESVTNEVESSDFFVKAQEFIASMGGRI